MQRTTPSIRAILVISIIGVGTSIAVASAPVRYFDKEDVAAAFARGAVLFDGDGANYMVHTSRRLTPGQAEVHLRDSDIIHVMTGTALIVTGGTVVDPKTTAPDEIRGSAIDGGQSRQLAGGDVLIVPKGVPHWFKEVPAKLTYFVVKVR